MKEEAGGEMRAKEKDREQFEITECDMKKSGGEMMARSKKKTENSLRYKKMKE
jgi:hypothetical protein